MPEQRGMFYEPTPEIRGHGRDEFDVFVDGIKVGTVEHDWRGWHHDLDDMHHLTAAEAATALVIARRDRNRR